MTIKASPTNLIISPPFLPIIFINNSINLLKIKEKYSGDLIDVFDILSALVTPFNSA